MKKSLFRSVLLLTFALVLGLMTNARAELNLDFNVVNATAYDIKEIKISPSGVKEWGPNILKAVLKDGQTLEVTFNPKATSEKWDIRAVYTDGEVAEWGALKLTEIEKLTLHWDKDKGSSATVE